MKPTYKDLEAQIATQEKKWIIANGIIEREKQLKTKITELEDKLSRYEQGVEVNCFVTRNKLLELDTELPEEFTCKRVICLLMKGEGR